MSEKPTYAELEKRIRELEQAESGRAQLDEATRNTSELLSFFIKHSPIYAFLKKVSTTDSRVLYASENYIEMIGISASQMIGKTMDELFPPEFAEKITRDDIDVIQKGKNLKLREDLNGRNYVTYKFPVMQGGNKYLAGYTIDITDLTQAQEDLAQIFAMSLDMICIADINTATFLKVNPAFTDILGYSVEELLEKSIFDFIHPKDIDPTRTIIERKLKMGDKVINFENRYRCKDGSYRWLSWVAHPNTKKGVTFAVARDITKWKRNEKELKKSKAMLDATGRMAKVGGWELDADTLKVTWTEETYRIHEIPLNYKPLLQDAINFFHHEDRPILKQAIKRALDHGEPYDMEIRFITANGKHMWTRTICEPAMEDGKVVKLKGTFQDITERKKTERDSLLLKAAVDQAPVGIALADPDINIYYCNPEGLGMRGGNIDDLVQIPKDAFKNWQVYMLNGEPYEIENLPLVRAIKKGKTIREDFIVKHQDGTIHICDAFACPVFENRKIMGGMVVFLDITERKQVEENIKKNEERLKNLLETIQAGVMVHDVGQSRVVKFNPAALKILRLTEDQILGKSTAEPGWGFVHENGRPMQVEEYPINIVKRTKQPLLDYVIGITNSSGNEPIWAMVRATPEFDQHGNLSEIIVSSMDITDLKTTQSQLKEKNEQLMHAQKLESIGNLAGGIAHDFNNILSSIIGFTELALEEVERESNLEDSLQEVYSAGKRAKDLVKQILAFARQSDEKRAPIQPSVIVKEVLKFIRSTIPTSIEIRQDIQSDSLIMGNATQVHQVLMNLCTNAAHAMDELGGVLGVSVKDVIIDKAKTSIGMKPGDYVEVKVSDTGTGIAPEIIGSIFEPYFTTKRTGEGTGMGLAMVHGVIESYGGRISVDSKLGKGTTFSIYLPITKKRTAHGDSLPEQLPTGTERILFVDDEMPIAKMGRHILNRLGYMVTARTSSIEALELFQAKPNDFDLVVTDMTMPNMTGDKLAIELMKIRPDIPVILCTGYSKKISDETASDIGIKAFAYKPVVQADLAKTIRKVLDEAKG